MKLRNRVLFRAGLIALVVLVTPIGEAKTVVTLWAASLTSGYDTWLTRTFPERVKAAYPGIELQVSIMGNRQNLEEKRVVATAAGTGPDIFHESAGFGLQIAYNGSALPLNRMTEKWPGFRDLIGAGQYQYKDGIYAIPYALELAGYAYWQDILENAGVPVPLSWDDLLSATRKLTLFDSSGRLKQAGLQEWNDPTYQGLYPFQLFTEQMGSPLYIDDYARPNFNTEQARTALDFARQLYEAAFPGGAQPTSGFTNRGTAMALWFGSSHSTALTKVYAGDELRNVHITKIPGPGGRNAMSIYNSWGWAISSQSKHPQEAWAVIERFLSPEVQAEFLTAYGSGGILSPRRSYRYAPDQPFVSDFAAMAVPPMTTWGPVHPFFGDVVRVAVPVVYDAIVGKRSTPAALAEVDRLLSQVFKEKGL